MVQVPTPLQRIDHPIFNAQRLRVYVKRDDLIHEEIMGNKWRKLKYLLQDAQSKGYSKIITLGGAYSNHIAATAAAGKLYGFETTGIIRGQELNPSSNPTLIKAQRNGMQLKFISREKYRSIRENTDPIIQEYQRHYFIPEGGTTQFLFNGFQELIDEIKIDFDYIITPIGTGGTCCGLINAIAPHQNVIGVSTLKGEFIKGEIRKTLTNFSINESNFKIITDSHLGGYGKVTHELIDFIAWFKEYFNIQLDPIYTGKSFLAVWKMIHNQYFTSETKIILLHTGGLQGNDPYLSKK